MSPGSSMIPSLSMKSWRKNKRKDALDSRASEEQSKASKSDVRRPDKDKPGPKVQSRHQNGKSEISSATINSRGAAHQNYQSDANHPDDQLTRQQSRGSDSSSDDSKHNTSGGSSAIVTVTKELATSRLLDTKVEGKAVAPTSRAPVARPPRPLVTGQSAGLSSSQTAENPTTADLSDPNVSRLAVNHATTAWLIEFSDVVAKWDGLECVKFANGHKELINNAHLISDLRRHAARNIVVGNLRLAEYHISAIAVATICREDPKAAAQQFFVSMGVHKRYHDICASERTHLERRMEKNNQPDHITAIGSTEKPDHLLDASQTSELIPPERVQDLIQDNFHLQPPQFFVVGRMFALIQHRVPPNTLFAGWPDHNPKSSMQVRVSSTIAYFVSVKMADEYCLALEAKTDAGRNVAANSRNTRAHEVIYETSDFPRKSLNILARDKPAIRVEGVKGRLEPTMRLDFGRVHTVEHKVPALEVGRVTDDSCDLLLRYWQEEMLATKA